MLPHGIIFNGSINGCYPASILSFPVMSGFMYITDSPNSATLAPNSLPLNLRYAVHPSSDFMYLLNKFAECCTSHGKHG